MSDIIYRMAKVEQTLIRLPSDRMHELRARAKRESRSLAGLVREAVDLYLGREPGAVATAPLEGDAFDALVGSISSGVSDASVNHDHYLYGWPREQSQQETPHAPVPRRKRAHRARRPE